MSREFVVLAGLKLCQELLHGLLQAVSAENLTDVNQVNRILNSSVCLLNELGDLQKVVAPDWLEKDEGSK